VKREAWLIVDQHGEVVRPGTPMRVAWDSEARAQRCLTYWPEEKWSAVRVEWNWPGRK
jgi:hypothetical protein